MTDVLKHRFTSPKIDGSDTQQVQPSHWNEGHKFQGGTHNQVLLRDTTDAQFGARWGSSIEWVYATTTGTVHNWNPGIAGAQTIIQWGGAADLILTGFAGGTTPGQLVTINNRSGNRLISCAHLNPSSTQQLQHFVSSAPTPIGINGSATYYFNGTYWLLIAHEQGGWITPVYSAGDYLTAGWTVSAASVSLRAYVLHGKTLTMNCYLAVTGLSGASGSVDMKIPGGFLYAGPAYPFMPCQLNDPATFAAECYVSPGATDRMMTRRVDGVAIPATGNLSIKIASFTFEVT